MVEVSWPHVVIDMLEACDDPRSAWHRRRNLFLPLTTRRGTKRSAADDETDGSQTSHPVENEPGLCDAIISVVARMKSGELLIAPVRLGDLSTGKAPDLPNLSLITQQQDSGFAFQVGAVDVNDIRGGELGAPLLFSSLLRNDTDADTILAALGHTWIVPRQSACCLCAARRWREMRPLIGCDGYRLFVLDPPWHSKSVQRAAKYTTRHKRDILADLVPAIRALRSPDACLLAVWVTNSIKVQEFVERVLFCSLGATAIARWYWVKLAADGKWTSDPTSAHRKPWEVLLIGYVGGSRQPSPPLPRRLAIVCVPYADQHSAKPSLDALLRQHAAGHLMGDAAVPSEEAWDRLPKCELFARDVKPHWHAYGDEVLRYQHVGWHVRRRS